MLVTGKEILDKANEGGYAVGAFNISNLETLQAVIFAAEAKRAPVIVQTSESAISYANMKVLSAMVHAAAAVATVPVALHLDHGTTPAVIDGCITNGWTSIMVDGSHFALEENIKVTKDTVLKAKAKGISVEAELGRLSGIEDQVSVEEKDAIYTNPDEALRFVTETGVDYLAVAIGTAHGKYKGEPKLDFDRLKEIKEKVKLPIVLHGSSGISAEALRKAISLGVSKINIDTDMRVAFADEIRKTIAEDSEVYDPRKILIPATKAMQAVVETKIDIFGSAGKA